MFPTLTTKRFAPARVQPPSTHGLLPEGRRLIPRYSQRDVHRLPDGNIDGGRRPDVSVPKPPVPHDRCERLLFCSSRSSIDPRPTRPLLGPVRYLAHSVTGPSLRLDSRAPTDDNGGILRRSGALSLSRIAGVAVRSSWLRTRIRHMADSRVLYAAANAATMVCDVRCLQVQSGWPVPVLASEAPVVCGRSEIASSSQLALDYARGPG